MDNAEAVHPLSLEEKVVLTSAGLLLCCFGLVLGAWGEAARAQTAPVFNVTPLQVNSGTTVSVIWYAGPSAPGGCIIYVTDATRTNYAPWGLTQSGSGAVTIYSDTTFDAVCLGSGGDYVYPPTRTYTVKMYRPHTLSVSATSVQYGQTITVNWDGGSAAGLCGVSLTDATRTNYQPWSNSVTGSAQATLTSDTTFTLTCINKVDGAYLTPQRTASVAVAVPLTCASGQTLYGGQCYQNTRSCTVANGTGTQSFSNGSYGSCTASSCDSGYALTNGNCVAAQSVGDVRTCNMGEGNGTQTWNGSGWGACVIHHCTSGYTLYNNTCYASYAPRLSVSATKVVSGDSVLVTWDGGTYAGTCAVYITDATRNAAPLRTALSGTQSVAITSNARFDMTCINKVDGAYLQPRPSIHVAVESNSLLQAIVRELAQLNFVRAQKWTQTAGLWEMVWEGGGDTPGDGATGPFAWSLPFDDDWNEPRVMAESFAFDTPSPGFLTIDRTAEPDRRKGGLIGRHDEYLSMTSGATFEFRIKINPDSADDGVSFIYSTGPGSYAFGATDPTYEISFSPSRLMGGGLGEERLNPDAPTVPFNTTVFNTYRFVHFPGENRYALYVNGNTAPIATGKGNFHKSSFYDYHDKAYYLIGIEGGGADGSRAGSMTLDYIRYRRGAFPPGASFTTPLPRMVPPLPPSIVASSTVWTVLLDGTKTPSEAGYPLSRHPAEWAVMGDGTLKLDSRASTSTFHFIADPPPGIPDFKGPYTIELRAKVLPGNTERGFSIAVVDDEMSVSMSLSPDKIETAMGLKPASYQEHAMDTTDGFHTYRLVHPARSLYSYVYVDDHPVPVIVDAHGSADHWSKHVLIEMGALPMVHRQNPTGVRSHVLIDYLRVSQTAYAPALP